MCVRIINPNGREKFRATAMSRRPGKGKRVLARDSALFASGRRSNVLSTGTNGTNEWVNDCDNESYFVRVRKIDELKRGF